MRAAAVVQGAALVVVPTVSTVLTSSTGLGLSQTAYGTLFIPQSIFAIVFSFAGAAIARRIGSKATLLVGFGANALSMSLVAGSALLHDGPSVAFAILACATSLLGFGFAIVTPQLNLLAATFEPRAPDRAVLVVNALLGGAAAVAPILFVIFVGFGVWWGLPLLCVAGMLALAAACAKLRFDADGESSGGPAARVPIRVVAFAAFAFLYGLCEQVNASWAPLYATSHLHAAVSYGSASLAAFWAVAAAARVISALGAERLPPAFVFRVLPFVLAVAFVVLARLPPGADPWFGVAAFALAGLGISALLPLVLSFSERSMPDSKSSAVGIVFATYLVGYGTAAFGVGPLEHVGIPITSIDGAAVVVACTVAGIAFAIVRQLGDPG